GGAMRWIKAAWRDPVLSKVIAVGIVSAVGLISAWAWRHLSATSLGFWSFLQSRSDAPVWFVLLLAVVGVLLLANVVLRALSIPSPFANRRIRKLNKVEAEIMALLARFEGGRYPATVELAATLNNQMVVIEHAVDELAKMYLLDTMYGDAGRLCWLSPEGRAYVVKHNHLSV